MNYTWRGGVGGVLPFPSPRQTPGMKPSEQDFVGAADSAGGVGGVPPLSSPRQMPGMKPPELGFIGGHDDCSIDNT